jgi:hypothetical protein
MPARDRQCHTPSVMEARLSTAAAAVEGGLVSRAADAKLA